MALGSVGVETHPVVGGGDAGECGRPHKWLVHYRRELLPTGFRKRASSHSRICIELFEFLFGSVTMSYG